MAEGLEINITVINEIPFSVLKWAVFYLHLAAWRAIRQRTPFSSEEPLRPDIDQWQFSDDGPELIEEDE